MNLSDLADRRLLFCINSGRSGSEYLSTLLDTAEEVRCWHERQPSMTGDYVRMINAQPYSDTKAARAVKCAAIVRDLAGLREKKTVYGETSHMFIKTFFDVVLEQFKNVDVIILRRDLAAVLKSFVELGYFSSLNKVWPEWMSSPNARTAAVPCAGAYESLDQFDRSIAYLLDIEARAVRFQREYPWVRTHEARIESLNDFSAVGQFFLRLRVTPTAETRNRCGRKVNEKERRKKQVNNPADIEYCRDRIDHYLSRAKALGIETPISAALERTAI